MLPLVAGGIALAGQMSAQAQAEEDARKQALRGLTQAYAQGGYAAPYQAPEGPDALNMLGGAGLAALDQGKANSAMAKAGEEADFGDDVGTGLRSFMRGRGM